MIQIQYYFADKKSPVATDPSSVEALKNMIYAENSIAKNFWMATDSFKESYDKDVKLCLIGRRSHHKHMHNLPIYPNVVALIVGMFELWQLFSNPHNDIFNHYYYYVCKQYFI